MFRNAKLANKIIGLVLICMMLSVGAVTWISVRTAKVNLYEQMTDLGEDLVEQIRHHIMQNEMAEQQATLEELSRENNIVYALVLDTSYVTVAHSDPSRVGRKFRDAGIETAIDKGVPYSGIHYSAERGINVFDVILPMIDEQGQVTGAINLGLSVEPVDVMIRGIIKRSILLSGLILLITSGLLYILVSWLVKPIGNLVALTGTVAQGDLRNEIKVQSEDEIGQLSRAFNEMMTGMRAMIRNIVEMSQYLASNSQQLIASAQETSSTAEHIAHLTDDVASGAEVQMNQMSQVKENVGMMNQQISHVDENLETLQASMNHMVQTSDQNRADMGLMSEQINIIRQSSINSREIIRELLENSNQISKIVGMIEQIASQTNLLALNAAIEAASAGDAGRGFTVVAEEIRKLADQSANSAKDIANLIRETQVKSEEAIQSIEDNVTQADKGETVVNQAVHSFEEIIGAINDTDEMFINLGQSSATLLKNAKDVAEKIAEIEAISNRSAQNSQDVASALEEQTASMEEITSTIEMLGTMADSLQELVEQFKM